MTNDIRKVAIVIDTLDQDAADALLDQMDEATAMQIREAVMNLDDVASDERDRVMNAFLNNGEDDTGVELELSSQSAPTNNEEPFRSLNEAPGETLAAFLEQEHPQTVAVVIAHLPPVRAAEVLRRFAPQLQTDVISRVADLDETDPDIVREIERALHSLLADEIRMTQRRSAGLSAIQAILSAASGQEREEFLANLTSFDENLASQVKDFHEEPTTVALPTTEKVFKPTYPAPQMPVDEDKPLTKPLTKPTQPAVSISFDDLEQLDDMSLARVLGAAKPEMTILALTGATESFVARILGQLPSREAKQLQQKIQQTGPLRLRDVDTAQQHLARLAEQLVMDGKIKIPTARRFAAAA